MAQPTLEQEQMKAEWLSFRLADLDLCCRYFESQRNSYLGIRTRIPYAPDYVDGLINLRGAIVPIVDLRKRLGLDPKPHDSETVILIMDVELVESVRPLASSSMPFPMLLRPTAATANSLRNLTYLSTANSLRV